MNARRIPRRQAIPILYTTGTHYDVGFDMGRTFGSIIKEFLELSNPLNDEYLPLYNTEDGKQVYNETLQSVKNSFPQYVRELEGIADGANVEFHKLFLLHMDDILPQSLKHRNSVEENDTSESNGTRNTASASTDSTAKMNSLERIKTDAENDESHTPETPADNASETNTRLSTGSAVESEAPDAPADITNTTADATDAPAEKTEAQADGTIDERTSIKSASKEATGCSTIILNCKNARILGHTEDALTETLNHFYFVVAHIINDTPQGKHNVKEERFMSLCYAGHLPGYTMNYNHHGLVFSINTLSATYLRSGHTPRHFITRALLATENYDQALAVLKDTGVGAADGCSINMTFMNSKVPSFFNIEMGPVVGDATESRLCIREIPLGQHNFHCNKYLHLKTEEANEAMLASSVSRMNVFKRCRSPQNKEDVLEMLGDCSGGEHCVFRENGNLDEAVKTIAVGIFDLNAKTYAIYSDNPKAHNPLVTLPLVLKC